MYSSSSKKYRCHVYLSNDFGEKEKKEIIEKHKCFGLVVLLEESYVQRNDIYDYYAKKYKLDKNSEEYKWLLHHIKVCNMYEIEKHCFAKYLLLMQ